MKDRNFNRTLASKHGQVILLVHELGKHSAFVDVKNFKAICLRYGFKALNIFRGINFKKTEIKSRNEIWFEASSDNSYSTNHLVIGRGESVEDALEAAINYLLTLQLVPA